MYFQTSSRIGFSLEGTKYSKIKILSASATGTELLQDNNYNSSYDITDLNVLLYGYQNAKSRQTIVTGTEYSLIAEHNIVLFNTSSNVHIVFKLY